MKPEKTPLPQHFLLVDSKSRPSLAVQNDERWNWPQFFLKTNESVAPKSPSKIRNLISTCCEARETPLCRNTFVLVDSESHSSLAIQNGKLWSWPRFFLKMNESVIPTSLGELRNPLSTCCEARETPSTTALFVCRF